jgi:hypothetical protein
MDGGGLAWKENQRKTALKYVLHSSVVTATAGT